MNGQKDLTAGVPLPLERAGRGAAEGMTAAAEQCLFRGEPITWLTVPTTKTVVTDNAFGDSEASERPGRKNNFVHIHIFDLNIADGGGAATVIE